MSAIGVTRDSAKCPQCGATLAPPAPTGRMRIWCSARCRKAAHKARRARRDGAFVVKIAERVVERTVERRKPVEHGLNECVARVIGSPTACRNVVRALVPLVKDSTLLDDPKWSSTLRAIAGLEQAVIDTSRPRRW
jgi:hypothetical protein